LTSGEARFEADVSLAAGQRTEVDRLQFHLAKPLELARARGDGGDDMGEGSVATVPAPGPVATAVAARGYSCRWGRTWRTRRGRAYSCRWARTWRAARRTARSWRWGRT